MTNTASIADRYLAIKAAADAAEAALKEIKAEINALGTDKIEGTTCDLVISLRATKALSEVLLLERLGVTLAQVNSCKAESTISTVINVKVKTPA